MNTQVLKRIQSPGPKKILACDGGGILGLMSVEILARLEDELRKQSGRPDLVLADYFDFVCGTSTGAIIAACLSAGLTTAKLRQLYLDSGEEMFERATILERLKYSYTDEPLARRLRREFNTALGHREDDAPASLGDPGLRTLLMMVMRNHTTDSPWPVSNHPKAIYNLRVRPDGRPRLNCNLDLPLWQLVRASTAAPTYFPPEVVTLARGTKEEAQFVFVDGGVTTYNNPAFLAFQMATAAPYQVNWPTGTDQMLLVSVSTGSAPKARPNLKAGDLWLLDHAKNMPSALMNAASAGWDMACRLLGECRFGPPIDREYGDMVVTEGASPNWTGVKQFVYVRYDPDVSPAGLKDLGVNVPAEAVQEMDSIKYIPEIQSIGTAYAAKLNLGAHLKGFPV